MRNRRINGIGGTGANGGSNGSNVSPPNVYLDPLYLFNLHFLNTTTSTVYIELFQGRTQP